MIAKCLAQCLEHGKGFIMNMPQKTGLWSRKEHRVSVARFPEGRDSWQRCLLSASLGKLWLMNCCPSQPNLRDLIAAPALWSLVMIKPSLSFLVINCTIWIQLSWTPSSPLSLGSPYPFARRVPQGQAIDKILRMSPGRIAASHSFLLLSSAHLFIQHC